MRLPNIPYHTEVSTHSYTIRSHNGFNGWWVIIEINYVMLLWQHRYTYTHTTTHLQAHTHTHITHKTHTHAHVHTHTHTHTQFQRTSVLSDEGLTVITTKFTSLKNHNCSRAILVHPSVRYGVGREGREGGREGGGGEGEGEGGGKGGNFTEKRKVWGKETEGEGE